MGQTDQQVSSDNEPSEVPRYTRRLTDKILVAFHQACDQSDFEVADRLLKALEMAIMQRSEIHAGWRQRNTEGLVAAHERLWILRHPGERHSWDFLAPRRPGEPEMMS